MSLLIDRVEQQQPDFIKRLIAMGILAYLRNGRKRGICIFIYKTIRDVYDSKGQCFYMDSLESIDKIDNISPVLNDNGGKCSLHRCYDAYDPANQLLVYIRIEGEVTFQVCDYTIDDLEQSEKHIECYDHLVDKCSTK